MTLRETGDCWGITLDSLHMKLNRLKNNDVFNGLIKDGKAKYYKPEGKLEAYVAYYKNSSPVF